MASKLGLEGVLYRNTGTYGSPTLNAVDNCRDLTLSLEKGKADVTTRLNGGWEANRGALKTLEVTFSMVMDDTDVDYTAIRDAFLNNTQIEFFVLSDDSGTSGAQGPRFTADVFNFSRDEQLREAQIVNVTIGPSYAANAPSWHTI